MTKSANCLQGKRVVALGAGTGQSKILRALLRRHELLEDLCSIVSVTDNGGHSGELRRQHNIPQVGDGKHCLLALAPDGEEREVFATRTEDGQSAGNTHLAELVLEHNSIGRAFQIAGNELRCKGRVLPATEADVQVVANFADHSTIAGEWEIIKREPRVPITRMSLSETANAYPAALEAISQADLIIICPGSFHTGIVSVLLPESMRQAVLGSQAKIIQVVNLMTQPGLTDGWDAEQHLISTGHYLGRNADVVIINNGEIPHHVLRHYKALGSQPVVCNGVFDRFPGVHFLETDLVPSFFRGDGERPGPYQKWTHYFTHSSSRLLKAIEQALS
ncbi:MAG: gluconeogenesis factor YvcK family protein [bacterium]